jgi:quercetin dioxygenase-like cupin family protein
MAQKPKTLNFIQAASAPIVAVTAWQGSIVMGVKGGEPVRLAPGQTFYEGPNDIHTIGRKASKTTPAKFLGSLDKDAPISVPVKQFGTN